ncbi:MAG: poly-gamma-glutamate hydrolase family protein [Thermodesulfobacteriota bacterium]
MNKKSKTSPGKTDTYRNFHHLSRREREGVDFTIEFRDRGSSFLIMALHGGRIEPMTVQLARRIAGEDLSFYGFRGIKAADNWRLHLTSHRFDEPKALRMAQRSRWVLTVHGLKGEGKEMSIGGLDARRMAAVRSCLEAAGFCFIDSKPSTAGRHPGNICNRGRSGRGVQLELSIGLRAELRNRPDQLERFAKAVREGLFRNLIRRTG